MMSFGGANSVDVYVANGDQGVDESVLTVCTESIWPTISSEYNADMMLE